MPSVVRAIAAAISPKKGNYMIFTPSFEYSDSLAQAFRARYPKVRCIEQKRNMTEAEKGEYLNSLRSGGESYLVAFAVMGGIYSEGIDLVGDSLIGAIVVGIGIPSVSYEREAMSAYYQDRFESGKEYAYIYPGMNRVF
jgi:Rad3-related DNA helicase